MADEFLEYDPETPTEQDLDQAYGSKYLSSPDVGEHKFRATIVKVRKEEMRTDNGKKRMKFVLYLDKFDKPMVLNTTNKDELVTKLGRNPANWIGAVIGLLVDNNVMYAGKRVKGLRLRVLLPPATGSKPAPAPKPAPAAAATEWTGETGDPGFTPDTNFEPAE
jgi:hypothetical protein